MADTLLRFGLWIIVAVLALYLATEAFPESLFSEFIHPPMLQMAGKFGLILVALGVAALAIKKAPGRGPKKGRCLTCGVKIGKSSLYCPQHVRRIIEEEDWRERTLSRKRPQV